MSTHRLAVSLAICLAACSGTAKPTPDRVPASPTAPKQQAADESVAADGAELAEPSEQIDREEPAAASEPEPPPAERDSEREVPEWTGPNGIPALDSYAPNGAVVHTMLIPARVRGTALDEGMRRLIAAMPFYRIAFEGTAFKPANIDALLLASASPRFVRETFVALRHSMSADDIRVTSDDRFEGPDEWTVRGDLRARPIVPSNRRRTPNVQTTLSSRVALVGDARAARHLRLPITNQQITNQKSEIVRASGLYSRTTVF